MPILKPEFHKTISENPRLWASRFDVPLKQIEGLLKDQGKIQRKTAEKMCKKYADLFKLDSKVSDLFDETRFIGADNRTVRHIFSDNPLSDDDKPKVFRFLFEKRYLPEAMTGALSILILIYNKEAKYGVLWAIDSLRTLWDWLGKVFGNFF